MKKLLLILIIAPVFIFSPKLMHAEFIFLKNGRIIRGKIITEDNISVTLKLKNRRLRKFNRSWIMRILYTNLYMGQQYIRLTNGKVIQAYKVDEDQDYFTFRMNLYKPKEFKIHRKKILFFARKNPNELQGTSDYTKIDINWKPPIGKVNSYRIYIWKKYEKCPDKPVDETGRTRYVITGLKSSTEYYVIVTAVDGKGRESLPSNEIELMTKNRSPEEPNELQCTIVNEYKARNRKIMLKAHLKWSASKDEDGSIKSYHIFVKQGKEKFKLAGKYKVSKKRRNSNNIKYLLKGLSDRKEYSVKVKAFDNRGAASAFSDELKFSTENRAPAPVYGYKCIKKKYRGGRRLKASLRWFKATDPDGIVVKYRIYKKGVRRLKRIGETRKTVYTIRGLKPGDKSMFLVRAVDNRNMESPNSLAAGFFELNISAGIPLLMPAGNFSDMFGYGTGIILNINLDNFYIYDLRAGIKTGYYYFTGKHEAFSSYHMLPILLSTEYSFILFDVFTIAVSASFGGSYNTTYYADYIIKGEYVYLYDIPANGKKSAFQPILQTGIKFEYFFKDKFTVSLGVEYGGIIEKTEVMHFFSLVAGFGMRF